MSGGEAIRSIDWLDKENAMRTVNVYKYQRAEGKTHMEKVLDGQALFHQWGVDYEEFETGAGNYSTAIVERSNGSIETPCATMIEFV